MQGALIFYSVFTLIYGLMNWLVFRQAAWALNLTGWIRGAVGVWFIIMILSPVVTGILGERGGIWGWAAFLWFGLVFYLFLSAVIVTVLRFATGPIGGETMVRGLFIVLMIGSTAACAWGAFHALDPVVKEMVVSVDNLPPDKNETRIAVISDVHLHSVEAESRLKRIIKKLQPLRYDILISLGDMIEPGIEHHSWDAIVALFDRLKPPFGKYAINGNHEYYANSAAGEDVSAGFHQACGFKLLVNQGTEVAGRLQLVGINDGGHGPSPNNPEIEILEKMGDDLPVLLLKHRPDVIKETIGRFDLMLSGHTHNGQMWPFNYMVKAVFPYISGYYELGPRSRLYVNSGTGTWGPPIRFGSTPEITLIRLVGNTHRGNDSNPHHD